MQCFSNPLKILHIKFNLNQKKDHITDIDALRCFIVSEKSRDFKYAFCVNHLPENLVVKASRIFFRNIS